MGFTPSGLLFRNVNEDVGSLPDRASRFPKRLTSMGKHEAWVLKGRSKEFRDGQCWASASSFGYIRGKIWCMPNWEFTGVCTSRVYGAVGTLLNGVTLTKLGEVRPVDEAHMKDLRLSELKGKGINSMSIDTRRE